jgi:D-amino-acid dehydrogenase
MSRHVLVIGCGLLGVSTAYFLRRHGLRVTVVDRSDGPGRETSYANGALLHTSLVDPWNAPGVLGQLIHSIGREDSALLLRLRALPSLLGWGLSFIRESRQARHHANTLSNAALASYSRQMMERLRIETGIEYQQWFPGTLLIFRDEHSYAGALHRMRALGARGIRARAYSPAELATLEPALSPVRGELVGGIHYLDDEGGDAFLFCTQLARAACRIGVEFAFGTRVDCLQPDGRRLRSVNCGGYTIEADAFVIAAGSYSAELVAPLGIRLPIRPVKGYSITVRRGTSLAAPRLPVIDHALHTAIVPVGSDRVRIAGTAEFAGHDLSIPRARIDNLVTMLKRILPDFSSELQLDDIEPWTGLRPVSVDGVPVLGRTSIPNLYLNTGHGHLGWTLAAGSGRAVADVVAGMNPALSMDPYDPNRF